MAKMKFKKGDRIKLKKYNAHGTVTRCMSHMVYVENGNGGSTAFCHPDNAELVNQ